MTKSTLTQITAVALMLSVAIFGAPAKATAEFYTSPAEAEQHGISSYNGGYYDRALPALEYAAKHDKFLAQFFLAELYADSNSMYTDHGKAYDLYLAIANKYANVDPSDTSRAPYVAKALTALARYYTRGFPTFSIEPDEQRAADYLHHAAIFFNYEDAQFELAKLYLQGEDVDEDRINEDRVKGRHWLASLVKRRHAGAQAFLADLHWRGHIVEKDPVRALALISIAVKNAPEKDRVWIEDVYQNIYCGASKGIRAKVDGTTVARWDRRYGRKPSREESPRGLNTLELTPQRVCEDGKTPPLLLQRAPPKGRDVEGVISADAAHGTIQPEAATKAAKPTTAHGFVSDGIARGGATSGFGFFRNVGE